MFITLKRELNRIIESIDFDKLDPTNPRYRKDRLQHILNRLNRARADIEAAETSYGRIGTPVLKKTGTFVKIENNRHQEESYFIDETDLTPAQAEEQLLDIGVTNFKIIECKNWTIHPIKKEE